MSARTQTVTTLQCDHCLTTITRHDTPSAARVHARSIGWWCVGAKDTCATCVERRRAAARAKLAATETGRAVLRVTDRMGVDHG